MKIFKPREVMRQAKGNDKRKPHLITQKYCNKN